MTSREVVLISPPTHTSRTPEECLGLEYLCAESRAKGHTVHLIDAWIASIYKDCCSAKILAFNPKIIGISPSMDSLGQSLDLTKQLRLDGFTGKIIMGGVYASFEARGLIASSQGLIDGILTGEADQTFQYFLESESMEGIPGAVWDSGDGIVSEPPQKLNIDLDGLPFPSRDAFPLVRKLRTPSHVLGSRGCYGNCSFCSVACFQKFSSEKRWRARSPESIISELVELRSAGENMVKFIDDNFFSPGDKSREWHFANLLKQANLGMRFRLSLRANDVDEELIKALKSVGLFAVSLGVESFVERKLRDYCKGTTVDQNLKAVTVLEAHGVYVQMGHIMFDPFTSICEVEEEVAGLEKTSWAITKGICTQLFAAEGTPITDRLRNEIDFVGKEGTNYLYRVLDPKVFALQQAIRIWSKHNALLYEKVTDPISAPKNVSSQYHKKFHELCLELRGLDLQVIKELLVRVHNKSNLELEDMIRRSIRHYEPKLTLIQLEVDSLYRNLGLDYSVYENKRI